MKYTDYNHGPMAAKNEGNYIDGYSMLPPEKWHKSPHPVKTYKDDCKCEISNVYEDNEIGVNLLKWKTEITPKIKLSEKYE